jgi:caa(3)-type oxidase subunit IV
MAGNAKSAEQKAAAYRQASVVALVLAALTILEFFLGGSDTLNSPVFLFIIAFIKAALVVYFFMHIYRLWREDEH